MSLLTLFTSGFGGDVGPYLLSCVRGDWSVGIEMYCLKDGFGFRL